MYRVENRFLGVGRRGGAEGAQCRFRSAGSGELNQTVGVHAQHGNPAGHLLKPTVSFIPLEDTANFAGEVCPVILGIVGHKLYNPSNFRGTEVTSAVNIHEVFWLPGGGLANCRRRSSLMLHGKNGVRSAGAIPPSSAQAVR